MAEHDVEQVWHDFWVPVLDGGVSERELGRPMSIPGAYFDQIKRELFDYHCLLARLPAFFEDITGGKVSKPNTDLGVVRQLAHEHILEEVKWRVEEELEIQQIEVDENAWQRGYDKGWEDGRERGFEDGIEEARNRI